MDPSSSDILKSLVDVAALAVVFGGIAVWGAILRRVIRRQPLVAFQSRQAVPWNGLDVIGILVVYVLLATSLGLAAHGLLGWELHDLESYRQTTSQVEADGDQPTEIGEPDDSESAESAIELDRAHPVVVLLSGDSTPGTFLLCLFSVVIMAPLAEEFFFRLLLQGYFEKVDFRCRRIWRYSGRLLGVAPILLSSLLFAALHARDAQEPLPVDALVQLFAIDSTAKVLLLVGAIAYLKTLRGATWIDLGLRFSTFRTDLRLAVAAFLAIIVPVYAIQEGLSRLLPNTVPDPVPLFFFALALGYLYFRTHRLLPAILLHLMFNAAALGVFFTVT